MSIPRPICLMTVFVCLLTISSCTTLVAGANFNIAWGPQPANNATNVHYKTPEGNSITLSWQPGDFAKQHDVYFGTSTGSLVYQGSRYDANGDPCSFTIKDPNNFALNTSYYWRIDETNDSNVLAQGSVWKFTTHNGKASNPKPYNGQVGLSEPLALSWTAGAFSASTDGHFVYIGTDAASVTIATSTTAKVFRARQTETSYSFSNLATNWYGPLVPGTTYYWKITEINDTTQWGAGISQAVVWTFTPSSVITIEDFEDYNTTADINANWMMGYDAAASCGGSSSTPSGRLTLVMDAYGKHGNFAYDESTDTKQFSEVKRYYGSTGAPFGTSPVLATQPSALRVEYIGTYDNSVNETYDRMFVTFEDSAGNIGVYDNPDGNAATVLSWTQWYVRLSDINSAGQPNPVQLAAMSAFYLGFGERCLLPDSQDTGGDGNVMFDNIQILPSSCDPNHIQAADFSGDCYVDLYDLQLFSDYWLARPVIIDFPHPTPPSKVPILWYKFNDSGNTSTVVDYGTGDANNYQGTVQRWSAFNWNATGGRNGDRCLYIPPVPPFPTNNQSFVDAPPAALGFLGDSAHHTDGGGVTISVWANASMIGDFLVEWPGIWGIWNTSYNSETVEVQCPSRFYTGDTTAATDFYLHTCSIRTQPVELITYRPLIDFGGRWNHWAWVKTNTNQYGHYGSLKIYCNGELIAEADATGQTGDPNAGATGPLTEAPGAIHIGTRGANWAMWSGYMQDFQIYDYALSTEEIEYLATDGTGSRVIPFPLKYNLFTDPGGLAAQIVNFEDLSVMGSQWHTVQLWP